MSFNRNEMMRLRKAKAPKVKTAVVKRRPLMVQPKSKVLAGVKLVAGR